MKDDEIRRAALRALIASRYGGIANHFANKVGKPASQINDMLASPPRKSFGAKIGRQFANTLGLDPLYFERAENAGTIPAANPVTEELEAPKKPSLAEKQDSGEKPGLLVIEQTKARYDFLSEEEMELISAWRNCNPQQREMIRLIVDQVAKNVEKTA